MNKDTTLLYKKVHVSAAGIYKQNSVIITAPPFINSLTYLTTPFAGKQPLTQAVEK